MPEPGLLGREPSHSLSPKALTSWRLVAAAWALGAIALGSMYLDAFTPEFRGKGLVGLALLVLGVGAAAMQPGIRYRRWRYEIVESEVYLQRGRIAQVRTIVPLDRVQHIDVGQGPLDRTFGLATVSMHTAAGTVSIPGLDYEVAGQLRERMTRSASR